jgi:hypothetical protein
MRGRSGDTVCSRGVARRDCRWSWATLATNTVMLASAYPCRCAKKKKNDCFHCFKRSRFSLGVAVGGKRVAASSHVPLTFPCGRRGCWFVVVTVFATACVKEYLILSLFPLVPTPSSPPHLPSHACFCAHGRRKKKMLGTYFFGGAKAHPAKNRRAKKGCNLQPLRPPSIDAHGGVKTKARRTTRQLVGREGGGDPSLRVDRRQSGRPT